MPYICNPKLFSMKSNLFILICILTLSSVTFAQSSFPGVIAHWSFDSTINDVSGNGLNPVEFRNVNPDYGSDGVFGHGLKFAPIVSNALPLDSTFSYLHIPYNPLMNLDSFTICSVFKISGFPNNDDQNSVILTRGTVSCYEGYTLQFNDNATDSSSAEVDTNTNNIILRAGYHTSSHYADWRTPTYLQREHWHTVVVTFDKYKFKIWQDDTLAAVVTSTTPSANFGTGTTGIDIGFSLYDYNLAGRKYQFNGILDDLQLYNRVLSNAEIHSYDSLNNLSTLGGIGNLMSKNNIQLYPTVATNQVNIILDNNENGMLEIVDMNGLIKYSSKYAQHNVLDVSTWASGMYIVRIKTNSFTEVRKFLKQ